MCARERKRATTRAACAPCRPGADGSSMRARGSGVLADQRGHEGPIHPVTDGIDLALLDQVKPGDKVLFKAVNEAGRFTISNLQVVK